jgi:hypothetical protein
VIFSGTDPDYQPIQYMELCPHRGRECTLSGSLHELDFANDSGSRVYGFSI